MIHQHRIPVHRDRGSIGIGIVNGDGIRDTVFATSYGRYILRYFSFCMAIEVDALQAAHST